MKVDILRLVLIAVISALVGWGCYEIASSEPRCIVSAIAAGVFTLVAGGAAVAISYDDGRTGLSIRVLSGIVCVIGLVMNVAFAFFEYNIPVFVICNGVVLVVYLLILQGLYRAKQQ